MSPRVWLLLQGIAVAGGIWLGVVIFRAVSG
jgi:hypothetical protein